MLLVTYKVGGSGSSIIATFVQILDPEAAMQVRKEGPFMWGACYQSPVSAGSCAPVALVVWCASPENL